MPQDEVFWNPYRMVPVRSKIFRKSPLTDEKFNGKNGRISCAIQNLTPLFVGGNRMNSQLFLSRNGKQIIPGSSLKGLLRSLAELVGGGCNVMDTRGQHSKSHQACNQAKFLCIACRMFGMMERGSGAKVHEGNICIGDAIAREDKPETKTFQILLSNCGTRHEPFYRNPSSGKSDGAIRKLYFHQPARTESVPRIPQNLQSRAWLIDAILPGHHFDFEIQFANLEEDELKLLLYVLALEDEQTVEVGDDNKILSGPLRHKIGNAKPLGLGSCHIRINRLTYLPDPAIRFRSIQETREIVYEDQALAEEISSMTNAYTQDVSDTMQQLRKMLVWDGSDDRDFRYPDYYWFKSPVNSGKVLKRI